MRQRIRVKHYIRRDGEHMIYVNGDHGVSLGWSEDRAPSRYGRGATQGKRNLISAFSEAIREADGINGDLIDFYAPSAREKMMAKLDIGDLYVIDDGEIGGLRLPSDGVFLLRDDRLINIDHIR